MLVHHWDNVHTQKTRFEAKVFRRKTFASKTRGTRVSTIGALGIKGLLTAFCYKGTLNGFLFAFFVKEFVMKVLTRSNVVILDNAKIH
ncbi:conserved hypothetical protein [Beggiatoa sp. PS]|nr:conserved hypothetical protein [Beggiatoa sp. PS]